MLTALVVSCVLVTTVYLCMCVLLRLDTVIGTTAELDAIINVLSVRVQQHMPTLDMVQSSLTLWKWWVPVQWTSVRRDFGKASRQFLGTVLATLCGLLLLKKKNCALPSTVLTVEAQIIRSF